MIITWYPEPPGDRTTSYPVTWCVDGKAWRLSVSGLSIPAPPVRLRGMTPPTWTNNVFPSFLPSSFLLHLFFGWYYWIPRWASQSIHCWLNRTRWQSTLSALCPRPRLPASFQLPSPSQPRQWTITFLTILIGQRTTKWNISPPIVVSPASSWQEAVSMNPLIAVQAGTPRSDELAIIMRYYISNIA